MGGLRTTGPSLQLVLRKVMRPQRSGFGHAGPHDTEAAQSKFESTQAGVCVPLYLHIPPTPLGFSDKCNYTVIFF